jgi:hypothetical protein
MTSFSLNPELLIALHNVAAGIQMGVSVIVKLFRRYNNNLAITLTNVL